MKNQLGVIQIVGGILLMFSIGSTLLILDNRYRFMQLEQRIADYGKRVDELETEVNELKLRIASISSRQPR